MLYEENEIAQALDLSQALSEASRSAASGVSIDSRTIKSGEVFFALKGERFDGAEFVGQALARGAVCAIVGENYRYDQSNATTGVAGHNSARVVKVADPLAALTRLGSYARSRTSARIIAITGSVGKTSLRALLENILPAPVAASRGNLNNHIGVPLSLARMARDSDYGVFELGMNHAGEIDRLSSLVRPHVGIITAIADAHIEFFKDEFAICDAKAEMFNYVSDFVLIPASAKFVERLGASAKAAGLTKIATFGSEPDSNYRLCEHKTSDEATAVRAIFPANKQVSKGDNEEGVEHRWHIAGYGRARALAGLCALALCDLLALDVATMAEKLREQQPLVGRGALGCLSLEHPARHIKVIDESYNSSPLALRNALASLASCPPRRIAALGDMLELGGDASAIHTAIAPDAARHCDLVFTCGELMQSLHHALPRGKRGAHRENARALANPLLARLKHGDTLLVKGSLASGMRDLLQNLEQQVVA